MNRHTTLLGIAATTLLSLALVACKHESEAKSPNGALQFELKAPSSQTITQGTTNQVRIGVDRKDFKGEIDLSFDQLPAGVRAITTTVIPANQSSLDVTLEAAGDAGLVVDKACVITAKGGGATTNQTFKVSVKQR
ncbi:MAG: hypothetical protein JNM84_01305 [Planctomycetes bacterium]|nr:hypothetical protein [Planctomycetota bacterium]